MEVFISIVIACFTFCIVALVYNAFDDQLICMNKFLHTYKVEGEVTGLDSVKIYHQYCDITIISYSLYDMKYKTFVRSSKKDKIGDKIWIATNGDIAARVKPYWRKDMEAWG